MQTGGRIEQGGRDVSGLPAGERDFGIVFQSYALFPNLTVARNVGYGLESRRIPRGERNRRVAELLDLVGLPDAGPKYPAQLSGGQQQRVALARAIVFQPDILLLDEPLGALDRKLREEVQVELRHLQRTLGITTILVTHDQEEALSLSDRIVVLSEGRVQQIATPQDAYLKPRTRFVAEFLGTANLFEARLEQGGTLALPDGTRLPASPSDLPAGSAVTAIVRPERIRLHRAEEGGQAGVAAEIEDMVYLGQSVRYHLRRPGGQGAVVLSLDRGDRFGPGQPVRLTWQPEDVWIIPG